VHLAFVICGSLSGVREGLSAALAQRLTLSCLDLARADFWRRVRAGLLEFHPRREVWRRRTIRRLGGIAGFDALSRAATDSVLSLRPPADAVLQVVGLFSSAAAAPPGRFFLYCDFTAKLADRAFPDWASEPTQRAGIYEREQRLYEAASRIFVVHEVARRSFVEDYGLPPGRVHIVGGGVRVDPLPAIDWAARRGAVLFVGKDFERHGGGLALDAMRILAEQRPEVRLLVVGAKVRQKGVRSWYRLPYDQLCSPYAEAGVLLVLAKVGGMATLLDGMAHGCACIALRGNPFAEAVIVEGEPGSLVSGDSAEQLATKTLTLIDDEDRCLQYAKQGRLLVEREFNWHRVVERMLPYLRQ